MLVGLITGKAEPLITDRINPESPVFADTWSDVVFIQSSLTWPQVVAALSHFTESMRINEQKHNPDPNAALYAMRHALKFAITDDVINGK